MIVKVQQSLSLGPKRLLIYNEESSVLIDKPADPPTLDRLRGRPKAFFKAELHPSGTEVTLLEEVPWQAW